MTQLIEALLATATKWRAGNQEYRGGVVLVWQGTVYGWKNSLRDAGHERPGVYAVDEAGHVFIAEGGDDYNGAKCWIVVDPASSARKQQCLAAWELLCSKSVAADDLDNWNTQLMDEVDEMLNERLINVDEADALRLRAEFRWTAENSRPDEPIQ